MRVVLCANCRTENVATFQFCYHCGRPPRQGMTSTRPPAGDVFVDHDKVQARRTQVLSAMDGRSGQVRKAKIAKDFDAFVHTRSAGRLGWESATPDDVFDWFCFLDTQGNGTTVVHDRACPGVGSVSADLCVPGSPCTRRYAAESLRVSFFSKLKMAFREELGRGGPWNPVDRSGNPCDSPLAELYLTFASEEQKRGGTPVKQAAPLLADTLAALLDSMRTRAQLSPSERDRVSITRDIALFSLAFYTMRRGFDLSFTMGSQVLELPHSAGMVYNFQFGKTLRANRAESVVVLADSENYQTCAFRAVHSYIEAANQLGWDLETGYLFPEVEGDGTRSALPLTSKRMTALLQSHLKYAGLPTHFTMHSFRVGGSVSEALAGTSIDEIMKLGGWKTEKMAQSYVGSTTSEQAKGKRREHDGAYALTDRMPLSDDFRDRFSACKKRRTS